MRGSRFRVVLFGCANFDTSIVRSMLGRLVGGLWLKCRCNDNMALVTRQSGHMGGMRVNVSGTIDSLISGRKLHWRLDRGLRQIGRLKGVLYRNIVPGMPVGRTFIFCTSYINDTERYKRWVDHVYPRRQAFGADSIFLINDGSDNIGFDSRLAIVDGEHDLPAQLLGDMAIVTFVERLGRPAMFCYPGWWRSFTYSVRIARHFDFDKIIHIESDAYVCSKRLADYLRSINRGWTVLWSKGYNFPETAIQVICRDAYPSLAQFADRKLSFFQTSNRAAEYLFPFDKVENRFTGDRCGILDRAARSQAFDYLAQVPPDWELHSDF